MPLAVPGIALRLVTLLGNTGFFVAVMLLFHAPPNLGLGHLQRHGAESTIGGVAHLRRACVRLAVVIVPIAQATAAWVAGREWRRTARALTIVLSPTLIIALLASVAPVFLAIAETPPALLIAGGVYGAMLRLPPAARSAFWHIPAAVAATALMAVPLSLGSQTYLKAVTTRFDPPPLAVSSDGHLVFTDVTVVSPGVARSSRQTVTIDGPRITAIRDGSEETGVGDAGRAYAGAYLLPGLIDMHGHHPPGWRAEERTMNHDRHAARHDGFGV